MASVINNDAFFSGERKGFEFKSLFEVDLQDRISCRISGIDYFQMVKSAKSTPKTSPPTSKTPSLKTSPIQSKSSTECGKNAPSTQTSQNKSTKNKSSKSQPGETRLTPSFGSKVDDIVPPSALEANKIVNSHRETDEDIYQNMRPKRKETPFKQLLIANIFLTIFNVVLFCVWIYLLSIFTWDNVETYTVVYEPTNLPDYE